MMYDFKLFLEACAECGWIERGINLCEFKEDWICTWSFSKIMVECWRNRSVSRKYASVGAGTSIGPSTYWRDYSPDTAEWAWLEMSKLDKEAEAPRKNFQVWEQVSCTRQPVPRWREKTTKQPACRLLRCPGIQILGGQFDRIETFNNTRDVSRKNAARYSRGYRAKCYSSILKKFHKSRKKWRIFNSTFGSVPHVFANSSSAHVKWLCNDWL